MCYIEAVATHLNLTHDIKEVVPDATLRRRMSRIVKTATATAFECTGGVEGIAALDAIITATGLGCLTDSERFLEQIHRTGGQMLNPTPFIQSTFNTVGAQIALLAKNHCYNMTYVHRGRSFESALTDAMLQLKEGDARRVLAGAFDENTPTQHHIMERMGFWRDAEDGEGAVFTLLTAEASANSLARISKVEFLSSPLSEQLCRERYATCSGGQVWHSLDKTMYPCRSAMRFAEAVEEIRKGVPEVVFYNEYFGKEPTIIVLQCL